MAREKSNKKRDEHGCHIGMKTLVTGATGFIGSHLVERLAAEGYDVRCLVRSTSDVRRLRNLRVEITVGDFFDQDSLREALRDVRVVHHVAGVTKARRERDYWRGNSEVTRQLLGATLKFAGSVDRFVHISTQAAVGPSYNGTPVNELTVPHPIDVYGKSKKEAEDACLEFSDKLPITIIRPGAVYGPRDHDTFAFFKWLDRGILPIVGSEKKRVALIYARDLVDGILLVVKHQGAVGQIYFFANEHCPTWAELFSVGSQIAGKKLIKCRIPNFSIYVVAAAAEPLAFFTGKAALFSFEKAKELAQPSWSCDVGKAKRELGYEAKTSIVDGMRETIEWYRREGWLKRTDGR
jgi:dihydroflavonol-4-reductase